MPVMVPSVPTPATLAAGLLRQAIEAHERRGAHGLGDVVVDAAAEFGGGCGLGHGRLLLNVRLAIEIERVAFLSLPEFPRPHRMVRGRTSCRLQKVSLYPGE